MSHRFAVAGVILIVIILFVVFEVVFVLMNGKTVNAPTIPRTTQTMGNGSTLNYVVMGDSTSIGQGTSYQNSYAYQSAHHLAKKHQVHFTNVGVSGARAKDVATEQLPKAVALKPDVVLLAVGANDVTHLTSSSAFNNSLQTTITGLKHSNPHIKIVVTGTAAMGSVPRFPLPLKQLAHMRTDQLNQVYGRLIQKNNLISAPIAAKTGADFLHNPQLFAQDKFHPNADGYKLWTPVITQALDQATQ